MKTASIQLETLTCPSCMLKIEGALKKLDGIDPDAISVSFNSSRVKLRFDDQRLTLEQIEAAITRVGYDVLKSRVKA